MMRTQSGVLKYPKLFEPIKVGNLIYKNRLFASPTMMSYVTEGGRPTEALMGYYREKARGGAAQVTIGDTPIDQEHAPAFPGMLLTKSNMAFLGELSYCIKQYGAVPSFELTHSGFMGNPALSGRQPISSMGFTRGDGVEVMQMDEDMIRRVVDNYANAALFVKECGFQGALIHGGHGWLLAQFLSPMVNRRTDKFGGSPENRARFPQMVVEAVREAVGKDFILEYRISGTEYDPKGLTLEETIPFVQSIQDKIDLVHVSAGIDTRLDLTLKAHPPIFEPHGCNVWLAEAMKQAVDIPVVTVGAISTPQMAEEILESGKADIVAMCRALIADPYLPRKARVGLDDEISPCTRCLHCRGHMDTHKHFSCAVNPRTGREMRYPQEYIPTTEPKRVLVVGGGPGGMKAAVSAAKKGHDVTLADERSTLGGQLHFTDYDEIKADLKAQKDYLAHMTQKSGVKILMNTRVSRAFAAQMEPDVIIVAAGARPIVPKFPGIDGANVMGAVECYARYEALGQNVVMIGGGMVGVETAIYLTEKGKHVTVIEMTDKAAREANRLHAKALELEIAKRGITVLTNTACRSIEPDAVVVIGADGAECRIPCDSAVYCVGLQPNSEVYEELWDLAPEVYRVGDCIRPGTIREAIMTGYYTALDI